MEFNLFLPQMRMSFDDLVGRARAAEAAGFVGLTGMDHLAPPLALEQPMFEAVVTATWLAAHTERLNLGSLVLCDAFRLPAVLARQAVSIDHASGGRYELGIGAGSVPDELVTFGAGSTEPRARVARLRETLEVVRALWSGDVVDYAGDYHRLVGARQVPAPLGHIPIVIGGKGPKMLALVPRGADREAVAAQVKRRFGWSRPVIGTSTELVDHYGRLAARGIERVYTWFCDFAPPETLAEFGEEVIAPLGPSNGR